MNEIIIYEDEMRKAMNVYMNIMSTFLYKPLTPAVRYQMEDKLKEIGNHYYRMDRNPVWKIPVEIVQTGPGSFDLLPKLDGVKVLPSRRQHPNDML